MNKIETKNKTKDLKLLILEDSKFIPEIYKLTISLGGGEFSLKNLKIVLNMTNSPIGCVSIIDDVYRHATLVELVTEYHKTLK